jgi:hypothetical protein
VRKREVGATPDVHQLQERRTLAAVLARASTLR